jgi:hypothetical protein
MLEGRTKQAREWREQRDDWWSNRLGVLITPRWVLQYWGTEVCRKAFHDDIWIASLENKLRNSTDDIVISDCRFPNEIKSIRDAGGIVVRVVRGPEPEWYDAAIDANKSNKHMGWALGKKKLEDLKIHASETAWVGTKFDVILDNNASIDDLFVQVKSLVLESPASTETPLYGESSGSLHTLS